MCDRGLGFPDGFDPARSNGGLGLRLIATLADQLQQAVQLQLAAAAAAGGARPPVRIAMAVVYDCQIASQYGAVVKRSLFTQNSTGYFNDSF